MPIAPDHTAADDHSASLLCPVAGPAGAWRRPFAWLYTLAALTGAFLLFLLELVGGKMILPLYGGTPAVWNTCLMFFQVALLLGYLYAHLSTTRLKPGRQAVLHLALLALVLLVLPPLSPGGADIPDLPPLLGVVWLMLRSVGVPFLVLSATAPLLQRWLTWSGSPDAASPWYLYSAGNIGSFLALLAFPVFLEPFWDLSVLARWWSGGFIGLSLLLAACAFVALRRPAGRPLATGAAAAARGAAAPFPCAPSWREKLGWLMAAAIPASLLTGVTQHITTNVAPIPLLWVVPLAIYLLTFVIVFARRPLLPAAWPIRAFPLLVLLSGIFLSVTVRGWEWAMVLFHLTAFLAACLVGHGRLARAKPAPAHLTAYYFWMAVGGALGGAFNALAAPLLFSREVEYPLVLAACALLLPAGHPSDAVRALRARRLDWLTPLLVAAFNAGIILAFALRAPAGHRLLLPLVLAPAAIVGYLSQRRPWRFALVLLTVFASVAWVSDAKGGRTRFTSRNFFGVKRVVEDPVRGVRILAHGTTAHGAQFMDPARRREPLTYYHPSGPAGDVFRTWCSLSGDVRLGIIGLGIGETAFYARPGQIFTYYEIDPEVVRLAGDTRWFNFLADCRGQVAVVVGDGRFTLARAPDGTQRLVLVDAFNSDAIPVHLLTREALAMYRSKLTPDGVIVFHASNRFVDLAPVLAVLAEEMGLRCLERDDMVDEANGGPVGKLGARFVAMGPESAPLRTLAALPGWQPLRRPPGAPVWTDRYSAIWPLLRFR